MSSFNINGPSNQPIIQGAQNLGKDGGGGGNTGYMNMRGKKKGEQENNDEEDSVFMEEGEDTFTKSGKKEESAEDKKAGKFLKAITGFLKDKNENKKDNDTFVKNQEDTPKNTEEQKPLIYENLQNEVPALFQDSNTQNDDGYYNDVDV